MSKLINDSSGLISIYCSTRILFPPILPQVLCARSTRMSKRMGSFTTKYYRCATLVVSRLIAWRDRSPRCHAWIVRLSRCCAYKSQLSTVGRPRYRPQPMSTFTSTMSTIAREYCDEDYRGDSPQTLLQRALCLARVFLSLIFLIGVHNWEGYNQFWQLIHDTRGSLFISNEGK